jgi:L-asparaginase
VHRCQDHAQLGLLPAGSLSPQKARVLLLLALIAGLNRSALEQMLQGGMELMP